MKSTAESAQIESEDVAAVKVLNTGESDMRARNIRIEDFTVLRWLAYLSTPSALVKSPHVQVV